MGRAIKMANDYGMAATDILQFRLRAEGKPQAFVGGAGRRLAGQFKQWPSNLATLYKNVIKNGDPAMLARAAGTIYFLGGATAMTGGELLYNPLRNELLKHGYILPRETGFQQVANQLGFGGHLENVDILSLRDPIGLPRDAKAVPSWIAGPTIGSLYDLWRNIDESQGDSSKVAKSVLSAVSPQLRAAVDAAEEFRHGGVTSPTGHILARRPMSSVVIRGLDLSPSVKTQRYQFKADIITALENHQVEAAQQLMKQARTKGIMFGKADSREIRSRVRQYLRQHARQQSNPESLLQ